MSEIDNHFVVKEHAFFYCILDISLPTKLRTFRLCLNHDSQRGYTQHCLVIPGKIPESDKPSKSSHQYRTASDVFDEPMIQNVQFAVKNNAFQPHKNYNKLLLPFWPRPQSLASAVDHLASFNISGLNAT